MIPGGYFLTGSRYSGDFDHDIGIMDGFGTYVYPDGSEYRGYFKMGKFHGYGTLSIKKPNKMLYVGKFKNGILEIIEEIVFSDGIRVRADQFGSDFSFKDWKYLQNTDRRFATELFSEINPVGPDSLLTNSQPSREVPNNTYDTGDGFFHPRSGFTGFVFTGNAFETRPVYFVSCKKEFNWICRNCRSSQFIQLPEPIQVQIDQQVLQNNLKCSNLRCSCGQSFDNEVKATADEDPKQKESAESEVVKEGTADEVEEQELDKLSVSDYYSIWTSDLSSTSENSFEEKSLILDMKCENKLTEELFNPAASKPRIQVYSKNVKELIQNLDDSDYSLEQN